MTVSDRRKGPMQEINAELRLDALEMRTKMLQRQLKIAAYGWLLTAAAIFLLAGWRPRFQTPGKPAEKTDTLRMRQLVMADEKGIDRIVIGPIPDPLVQGKRMKRRSPATGVQVNDASGNERVGLAILDDGSTVVGMDDELGRERAHLYYIPKKGAGILLHGDNEKETISLLVPRQQQSEIPKVEVTDEAGKPIAVIPAQK